MTDPSKQISEMIRSGEYFTRSRAWYQALYIAPIAERTFFLLIAALAGFIALLSVIAVMSFLPLTDRPGIPLSTARLYDEVPRLLPLRAKGDDIAASVERFYVSAYVQMREGYAADDLLKRYRFMQAHSDGPTFAAYAADYRPENPKSPAAMLGQHGKRLVGIHSIVIRSEGDTKVAIVQFTTINEGTASGARTNWTATLQFYYSDLVVNSTEDPETGEHQLTTQDPQFQVVDYALTKAF